MKKDSLFERPAIVRSAEKTNRELLERANEAIGRGEKAIIEAGHALLELKARCKHGEFQAEVKARFCSTYRTAARAMRAAKSDTVSLLGEVMDAFELPVDDDPEEVAATGPKTPDQSSAHPKGSSGQQRKDPNLLYCRQCRMALYPKKSCRDCEIFRANRAGDAPYPHGQDTPKAAPPATPSQVSGRGSPPAAAVGSGCAAEAAPTGATDPAGQPIPEQLASVFETAPAIAEWCLQIDAVAVQLHQLHRRPCGVHIPVNKASELLRTAREVVEDNTPKYVCPDCRAGRPNCSVCEGSGVVSEVVFKELSHG